MDKIKITHETWNKIAELYQSKFMNLDLYNSTYNAFCKLLNNPNATVLEIGCGPGNITKYLATKNPQYQILGTDVAPNMIALAKKNVPEATFEVLDCRKIKNINGKYNGIVCGFCIPYLSKEDCEKFIFDCHQLLLPKGVFYLSFVEGDYSTSDYQTGSSGDKVFFYFHELKFINQLLKNSGFTNLQVVHVNYPKSEGKFDTHTIIFAIKQK